VCRLQQDILALYSAGEKHWDSIPKFLAMRKYPTDIRQYGMTDLYTSGPKESFVKVLRQAWQYTNKQTETVDQQVLRNLSRVSKPRKVEKVEAVNMVGGLLAF
jgi:hypothetical protein